MSEIKKMSVNNLRRIVGEKGRGVVSVNWHKTEVSIKKFLTTREYIDAIREIVHRCSLPDDEGVFVEFLDFAIRSVIIESYACIELPQDVEELFYIVYASDLYDTVLSVSNGAQINSIINAVKMQIK